LTPPRRKTAAYACGLLGAVAAGFASHYALPVSGHEASSAVTSAVDKRLLALDLKLEELARQVTEIGKGMSAVKCRLNIENTCPPERGGAGR